jgi:macrodomain Ter protein organizer (MatP/YcbG family)
MKNLRVRVAYDALTEELVIKDDILGEEIERIDASLPFHMVQREIETFEYTHRAEVWNKPHLYFQYRNKLELRLLDVPKSYRNKEKQHRMDKKRKIDKLKDEGWSLWDIFK